MFKNKKILVAGGTGTIGIPLVRRLLKNGADVTVASIDDPEYARELFGGDVRFVQKNLIDFDNCLEVTRGQEMVLNLVGIKGSTGIGESKVARYLVNMLWFQTNLMEAAYRNQAQKFLFISSICAYPQSDTPKQEDSAWDGMPKQNDRIPGLAKRIGEIQGEAYLLESDWEAVTIVRPSNVFGPFDDFEPATAQVIPALIRRMIGGEDPIKVWGDGSAVRDFIFSEELADWILLALEKAPPCVPINLGSGVGITIKQVAETIAGCVPNPPKIEWDAEKPTGDPVRLLSTDRARELLGYEPRVSFEEGIRRTVEWYLENQNLAARRGERKYE